MTTAEKISFITNGLIAILSVMSYSKPNYLTFAIFVTKIIMDFVVHLTGTIPMTRDIFLHHFLVSLWSVHFILFHTRLEAHSAHLMWWCSLCVSEVSSIFLSVMNVDQQTRWLSPRVKLVNQCLFAASFFYFRIFWFAKEMFFPLGASSIDEYTHHMSLVAPSMYITAFQWSMYLFFSLNLYWACKIVRMIILKRTR